MQRKRAELKMVDKKFQTTTFNKKNTLCLCIELIMREFTKCLTKMARL